MERAERQKELRRLAFDIRQGIMSAGIFTLDRVGLTQVWQERDEEIADSEKRLRVRNFAAQFGFDVMVDFDFSRAVFTVSRSGGGPGPRD